MALVGGRGLGAWLLLAPADCKVPDMSAGLPKAATGSSGLKLMVRVCGQ